MEDFKGKSVRAPYNFIPFSNKIIARYKSEADIPGHDTFDPDLLTGEFKVTITAQTPICISDGQEDSDFVKGANGQYMIPGSSLRGLIRENMQILGLGKVRVGEDIDDNRILFRDFAGVRSAKKDLYTSKLGVKTKTVDKRSYTVVENVHSGYLHNDGERYFIVPTAGDVIPISRKDDAVKEWNAMHAFSQEVFYRMNGKRIEIRKEKLENCQSGVLMSPGVPPSMMAKDPKKRIDNHLFLFPREDEKAPVVMLSRKDILNYEMDYDAKKNGLSGTGAEKMDPEFWNLIKAQKPKPVFYSNVDGMTYFGVTRFLRIGYEHSLCDGLPKRTSDSDSLIDYPYAILGFANADAAFRSRVSVGDCYITVKKGSQEKRAILAEPKPSFFPAYVCGGKDYNQDDFQLRGFKQYWLKNEASGFADSNGNVASKLNLLNAGTTFEGTIRYRNLHKDELGLLLWCLRLEEGCFQNMGKGKPLGYGRVEIKITVLKEYNLKNLYDSLNPEDNKAYEAFKNGEQKLTQRMQDLISDYQKEAAERSYWKKKPFCEMEQIRDFFYMKRKMQQNSSEFSYMNLDAGAYQNVASCLKTVQRYRSEEAEEPKPAKQSESAETFDWLKQLQAKNSANKNAAKTTTKKKKW